MARPIDIAFFPALTRIPTSRSVMHRIPTFKVISSSSRRKCEMGKQAVRLFNAKVEKVPGTELEGPS